MNNLSLTEEQVMILDTVRKLVQDTIDPSALERDEHRQFAEKEFQELAELGLLGMPVAEERGGAGMGMLSTVVALEEIGGSHAAVARLLVSHANLCGIALENFAPAAERLEGVMTGALPAAFVGLEHGIRATAAGDAFTLDGVAEMVTAAGVAQLLVVAARAGGDTLLFCLPGDAVRREEVHSLGLVASAPARLVFEATECADGSLVARGEEAAKALARAATAACIGTAAQAVGSCLSCIAKARTHAGERIAFGKPLLKQHAVARKLVESHRAATAARHLTWHAARLWDAGEDAAEAARLARISAVEAMIATADEAIQILGGYGYTVEYHVERHYRDGQTLVVLDGGSESLRDQLVPA